MVTDDIYKTIRIIKDLTSTSVLIIIVIYLVWNNTGDRNSAIYGAKASAEEAVNIGRGIAKVVSEDSSINRMILIQICVNTARGNSDIINQCTNYR